MKNSWRIVGTALLSSLTLVVTPVAGQTARPVMRQVEEVKADTYQDVLENIIQGIDQTYPVENIANRIIATLQEAKQDINLLQSGEKDFVAVVNGLLKEASNDLHLRLFDKEMMVERQRMSGNMKSIPRVRTAIRRGNNGEPEALGQTKLAAEMISEEVGLLTFHTPIYRNKDTFTDALNAVAKASTIVIDLRKCRGGSNFGVRYFLSQFYNEPTHLSTSVSRRYPEPVEMWTEETPLSNQFAGKDVYLLVGKGTASGAEAVTFAMKNTGRATVVGGRTRGAGNAGAYQSVGKELTLFLPMSRTINPVTGDFWEAKGVKPHIAVPEEKALEAALNAIERI